MAQTSSAKRILVVEDDEDSAEMLAETFRERGHEVEIARDGVSALHAASRFRPQVAILDVGLPLMSGYEVARRMRLLAELSEGVRLLALTGYSTEEERRNAREAGFDEHFVKPVHPDILTRAVEADG